MPAEHYRPDGTLAQGYYCNRCGEPCALYGQHIGALPHHPRYSGGEGGPYWDCLPNPELVRQCRAANPTRRGIKPRFIVKG
jgi:hypothetical protein